MKTLNRLFLAALGMVVPVLLAANCSAQCTVGLHSRPAHNGLFFRPGHVQFLPVAFSGGSDEDRDRNEPGVVGLWRSVLIAEGTPGVKDGTQLEQGLTQWHSDHTEIDNNASNPPISGSFCLGVWEKVGERTYKINHFPMPWDPTGTAFLGPANYRAEVTLSADGKHYLGHFTLDQYESTGKMVIGHAQGIVKATRITINTTVEDVF